MSMDKVARLIEANRVIEAISRRGRRFFYSESFDRISAFEIDSGGRLRLRDRYTNKLVYIAYRGRWRHFTEGGTLRSLVEALAGYIRTGVPIKAGWFGPWPQYVCDGDLWGYGAEEMVALRAELSASPAVASKPVRAEAA